jgi:hypothetical protein
MTVTLESAAGLAALSLDELAELWHGDDAELSARALAETERRDRAERASARRRNSRRNDPVSCEWRDAAHAQFLQAEAELNGHLVARHSALTSAWPALWTGNEASARARASEEMNLWWDRPENRRITVTQYRGQVAENLRREQDGHESEEWTDGGLDTDARDSVQRVAGTGSEGAQDRQDGAGHAVSRTDAGAGARGRGAAGATARPGHAAGPERRRELGTGCRPERAAKPKTPAAVAAELADLYEAAYADAVAQKNEIVARFRTEMERRRAAREGRQ